jgi:hypothetical protein
MGEIDETGYLRIMNPEPGEMSTLVDTGKPELELLHSPPTLKYMLEGGLFKRGI